MGEYATFTDVEPRVAGRPIGASTKPTSTEVTTWCTAAENMLLGALRGSGINVPAAGTNGGLILTEWVVDYAEGRVRMAWDVREDSTDKQSKVDDFNELLGKIADNSAYYDAMLNGGSAGETSLRVRGYVLDNEDGKSIANGDFDPEFTIGQES